MRCLPVVVVACVLGLSACGGSDGGTLPGVEADAATTTLASVDTASPSVATDPPIPDTDPYLEDQAPSPTFADPPRATFGRPRGFDRGTCTFDGIELWGNVRVVDFGADLTVRDVDYGADLRVRRVDFGANSCGLWRFVDYGADFTVRFVDFGADLTVQQVDFGPGA